MEIDRKKQGEANAARFFNGLAKLMYDNDVWAIEATEIGVTITILTLRGTESYWLSELPKIAAAEKALRADN